ncbi:Protein of unknown function [Lactobacillus helveticus CIRM-BIA 951]|uniref:Uncharacterized protein n=1 Tax=Lactobacillus helveticus CIRM-BIA 951 TaxID=1226334 RepID=U6F105_LACHE|nr:Protein of unknown function [Lactobacillus helveticus CIRM-BIA 951]
MAAGEGLEFHLDKVTY